MRVDEEVGVIEVGRCSGPTPCIVLHVGEGGAIVDLGRHDAEVEAVILGELEGAVESRLHYLGIRQPVTERRTCDQVLRRIQRRRAGQEIQAECRQVLAPVDRGRPAVESRRAQNRVGPPGVGATRFGLRVVEVECQRERISGEPFDVQADGVILVLDTPVSDANTHVTGGRVGRGGVLLRVDGGAGKRAVRERDRGIVQVVEPCRELGTLRLSLELGVGVVERGRQPVRRRKLQRELTVDALALNIVKAIEDVLRDRIDVTVLRGVLEDVEVSVTRQRDSAPGACIVSAQEALEAAGCASLVVAQVALLVTACY